MKIGSLIVGIILLMIGAVGYGSFQGSASDCQSTLGQVGRFISSDISQRCSLVSIGQIIFIIIAVIGLGVLIYGAVATRKAAFVCGYCKYMTNVEENLYNHYEQEHRKSNPVQETKDTKSSEEKNLHYLGILKERLAKGEISKEEYNKLKGEFE